MNTKFAKRQSGKFSLLSLLPLFLISGGLVIFSDVRPPDWADTQTMPLKTSVADELRTSRFARTWAITLRNQYRAADRYRQALRQPQTIHGRMVLEARYTVAAREYDRMAQEAPVLAFHALSQPRSLPLLNF